jgi:hypothetical protein
VRVGVDVLLEDFGVAGLRHGVKLSGAGEPSWQPVHWVAIGKPWSSWPVITPCQVPA